MLFPLLYQELQMDKQEQKEVLKLEPKDPFEALYKELLKKPQGDVMVARIKAFLAG
jgi:hypothetical protein